MSEIKKLLGERIKILRKSRDWSQEDLANRADINRSFMGKIERGEVSATIDSFEKIANAFNIELEDLFKNLQAQSDGGLTNLINIMNRLSTENVGNMMDFLKAIQDWKCK